jgi:hypothetical protein
MAVKHNLPGLTPAYGKTQPINHVIKPPFQQNKQILTRNTGHTQSPLKKETELLFLHTIDSLKLLFFPELNSVIGSRPRPELGIFARGRPLPIDSALVALATFPFEHQFFLFRPTKPADRPGISCHFFLLYTTAVKYGAFSAAGSRYAESG